MIDNPSNKIPPEPEITGVIQEQIKSDIVHTPVVMSPSTEGMREYAISEDLESSIDSGINARTARALIRTIIATNERDLNRARSETILSRQDLEEWKKKYYNKETECSVLKERAIRYREQRTLQNIFVTFGGLMAGGSLKYIEGQYSIVAIAAMIIGSAFVVIGWLYPFSKEKEA
jgi:hypothetical protein